MNQKNYRLVYDKPPENNYADWENLALPIGNGNLGAKVFGLIGKERIQYNEKTLWSGGPKPDDNHYNGGNLKGRYKIIKNIRQSLDEGDVHEAQRLAETYLVGPNNEQYGRYLAFGDLYLDFHNEPDNLDHVINYKRELDIRHALFKTSYEFKGTKVKREVLASDPDGVIAYHIKYEGTLSLNFTLKSQLTEDLMGIDAPKGLMDEGAEVNLYYSAKKSTFKTANVTYDLDTICLAGKVIDNDLNFASYVKIDTDGKCVVSRESVEVINATYASIYLAAETDYAQNPQTNYRENKDILALVKRRVINAVNKGYSQVKKDHIADYQQLFNRLEFTLTKIIPDKTTDQLLLDYRVDKDKNIYLEELFFQYGRYLLIASSRPGCHALPANLQGIWNAVDNPPWNSDYHLNVNLQMIYWPVYATNLTELSEPLINFVDDLRYYGRVAAKEYAGIESKELEENGWLVHTQTTPYGWTTPGWDYYWGWAPTANAWIVQNVYDYYRYTLNTDMLKNRIYAILKETASFWNQFLHYDLKNNRYVSSPSYSPEHGNITVGNTFDQSVIWQLFHDYLEASEKLGIDDELVQSVRKKFHRLHPIQLNHAGYIKEWYEEDDPNFDSGWIQENHRHISHLVGLYPGDLFNDATSQELEGAKKVLNQRGDGGTGWAKANKINLWARLLDGNRAHKLLSEQLCHSTLANLWDTHPPFQLDGNMGALSGMCEMLMQSHKGKLSILPALPKAWSEGRISGLIGRGNIEMDISWYEYKLTCLKLKANKGGDIVIEYPNIAGYSIMNQYHENVQPIRISENQVSLSTDKEDVYTFKAVL